MIELICNKRCIIGEGPIWNERQQLLYFTNGFGNEICMLDIKSGEVKTRPIPAAAIAFDKDFGLIVSTRDGVFRVNHDDSLSPLYDTEKYSLKHCNDMKVGPDGRIYVGTQSSKRMGISENIDGKLYSIDKSGEVKLLLDGLILSNGLEWSMDEKYFYHTDSDTRIIKEYAFDKVSGSITLTGRKVEVCGVDGFTVDCNNNLIIGCWGEGHLAVVDTAEMKVKEFIETPAKIPASCCFAGENMEHLAIVTASYNADTKADSGAGLTYIYKNYGKGRKPYLFGSESI